MDTIKLFYPNMQQTNENLRNWYLAMTEIEENIYDVYITNSEGIAIPNGYLFRVELHLHQIEYKEYYLTLQRYSEVNKELGRFLRLKKTGEILLLTTEGNEV